MSEKYTGKAQDRRYVGQAIDITYSLKRCIHAKECVNRLSQVFDYEKRPWINASGANAEEIASIIHRCPSGALHYERKDGGNNEPIPDENTVIVWHNGPLQFNGNLTIQGASVEIDEETRVTLCRCGASKHKPFCDNTHLDTHFEAQDNAATDIKLQADTSGKLTITPGANGSVKVEGNVRIETQDGRVLYTGSQTWLCRCGHSRNKPFCDGSHKHVGFEAD